MCFGIVLSSTILLVYVSIPLELGLIVEDDFSKQFMISYQPLQRLSIVLYRDMTKRSE